MLHWGVSFAVLGWLAIRFCAAIVLGLAVVIGSIVVCAVAGLAIAIVGDMPPKRSL
jgi:hypothetical protein